MRDSVENRRSRDFGAVMVAKVAGHPGDHLDLSEHSEHQALTISIRT